MGTRARTFAQTGLVGLDTRDCCGPGNTFPANVRVFAKFGHNRPSDIRVTKGQNATEDEMFKSSLLSAFGAVLALVACSPAEMPSRGLNIATPSVPDVAATAVGDVAALAMYHVVGFDAVVPRDLLVSEADVYLPIADIVWHGDPEGDRYAQIEAIFETALGQATADMTEGREVKVVAQVLKFHGVTDKTRATVGGNFAMHFYLTVLDAHTGALIDGPRLVVADTPASGGVRALREEQRGITQKFVVTNRLVEVFDEELAKPAQPPADNLAISRNDFSPSDLTLAD